MRALSRIALLVLFVHLGLILFTNRALFTQRFDEAYWKDKYEHSQWKLPLSQRTIGDDGLYLYEGYRLASGADPTLLNAEVPPLGKYLIGASVLIFHNGHMFGLLVYGAVLVVFFLLTRTLFSSTALATILTTLLALDPLLTSQATLTMLDSLQLLFLLLFFLLLAKRAHPMALGALVGLFAETKFGILAPILLAIGGLTLWKERKKIQPLFLFFLAAVAAYIAPYLRFFTLGHTPLEWLQVQKWIVTFYVHSNLNPTIGSAAAALLWGQTQNIFSHVWEPILEWSPVWSIVTVAALGALLARRAPEAPLTRRTFLYLRACALLIFLFYLGIPFWTRYLLLLLPLLYIGFGALINKHLHHKAIVILFGVLLAINAIASLRILFPTPERTVRQFTYEWEHGFFQDMYETTTRDVRAQTTRDAFRKVGLTAYHDGEIESVVVSLGETDWSHVQKKQTIPVTIVYITRNLGAFEEKRQLPVIREDGQWRIPWEWNFLIEDFSSDRHLTTTLDTARRGSIVGEDKKAISYDFLSALISIVPNDVDPKVEDRMLAAIETLFKKNVTAVAFHQRYVGNALPNLPIAIAILGEPIPEETRLALLSFPGLHLTSALGRFQGTSAILNVGFVVNTQFRECCSSLYSTTSYDGFEGIEKNYNDRLKGYHGGTLVLYEGNDSVVRTLIKQEKQDGKNVDLLSTFNTP
jgi:hypothetical protein